MRCNNCGRDIDEDKYFCKECEKGMKKASSKDDIRELEELIESQKKLDDFENTKELVNLEDLAREQVRKIQFDKTITDQPFIEKEEIKENVNEDKILETREELNKEIVKKSNKKIIIIIIIISVILISTLILLLLKPKEEIPKEEKPDYKKIIKNYGNLVTKSYKEYLEDNDNIPTWQELMNLIEYDKYDIVCQTHNLYKDGTIYLNKCKVNGKKVKYTYGKEQEEKEGKKINIYTINDGEAIYYSDNQLSGYNLLATITCETQDCIYCEAYDKYVIIKENEKYYLYDYENDSLEFGPFDILNNYSIQQSILTYDNKVYGIFYNEDGINNIYSIETNKIFKNIKGTLAFSTSNYNPAQMLKYNYIILNNNNKFDFLNLKTGNISFKIKENILNFIENPENKIVYITTYEKDLNKFRLYNSNGKLLFDGKEFYMLKILKNKLIVSFDKKQFSIYDSNINLKLNSKKYDQILAIYNDFIVVIDNNHLSIIDLKDQVLATFEDEWDDEKYIFHSELSGADNKKIYLLVEDTSKPYQTLGRGIEYYYVTSTKEVGKTETNGVGIY